MTDEHGRPPVPGPDGPLADYPVLRAVVQESAAVSSFPHGTVFVFDHDLRYTHVGGAHLTALGRDRTDFVGRTVWEMFDEQGAAARAPAYRRALAGENVTLDAPMNGDRVLEIHVSPLLDGAGAVVAALGYTLDVTDVRRDANSLQASQEQFRLAFEKAPIGMALARLDGTLFRVNPALCRLLRAEDTALSGNPLDALVHADDAAAHAARVRALLEGDTDTFEAELRLRRPADGTEAWVLLTCTLVRTADTSAPSHLIVQVIDVSERRAQTDQIAAAHAFQQAVLAASPDIIHVRDVATGTSLWTSRSISDLLGYTPDDIADLGAGLADRLVPEEDRARFDAASRAAEQLPDGEVVQVRHRAVAADGATLWMSRRLTPFRRDDTGQVTQLLGLYRDVTDSVALEERLEHAALHDELTGLPNRRLIRDRITRALQADDPTAGTAVLFCDLDGFKGINDQFGHAVGDRVLSEVADRLGTTTRGGDTVGRLGGDEFVIVLRVRPGEDATAVAQAVAGRVRTALAGGLPVDGQVHRVTASVGIAVPGQDDRADDVLRQADQAMYRAKLAGKDRHVLAVPAPALAGQEGC